MIEKLHLIKSLLTKVFLGNIFYQGNNPFSVVLGWQQKSQRRIFQNLSTYNKSICIILLREVVVLMVQHPSLQVTEVNFVLLQVYFFCNITLLTILIIRSITGSSDGFL